jgi:hypothetical protein
MLSGLHISCFYRFSFLTFMGQVGIGAARKSPSAIDSKDEIAGEV